MDPITLMLAGGAAGGLLGLGKYYLVDKPRESQTKAVRASEIAFSPWTKLAPSTQVEHASAFNNLLQGGMAGGMMGQSVGSLTANKELLGKLAAQQEVDSMMSGMSKPSYFSGEYQPSLWRR